MVDRLIGVAEAAEILGVKPATLYDWRVDRKGPKAVKVGRLVKYRETDLAAYITAHVEADVA